MNQMVVQLLYGLIHQDTDEILDNSRGDPKILSSSLLDGRMVVAFNGFSQLYSSDDYGALLGEYTILTLARHSGSLDQSVISSVGSNWVFGLGNNYSSYWKLGSGHEFMGSASDDSWHLYAGTLSSSGTIELIRDGYQVEQANISLNEDSKPRFLAFEALKRIHPSHNLKSRNLYSLIGS